MSVHGSVCETASAAAKRNTFSESIELMPPAQSTFPKAAGPAVGVGTGDGVIGAD
jgi:hypothetical protein